MDIKVLNAEYEKLDKEMHINTLIRFKRGVYYNPANKKYSKDMTQVIDSKDIDSKNYVLYTKGDYKYGFVDAMISRLSSDGNILFLLKYRLNLYGIDVKLPQWLLSQTFALTKEKEMYATISHNTGYHYSYCSFEDTGIFVNTKRPIGYTEINEMVLEKFKMNRWTDYHSFTNVMNDKNLTFPQRHELSYTKFAKTISSFYGGNIKTIASNRVVDIEFDRKSLVSFINYKEPVRKTSKTTQKYQNIKLPNITGNYPDVFGYAQYINENCSVLRILSKNVTTEENEDIIKIFVEKDKTHCIKKTNNGSWVHANCKSLTNWEFPIYNVNDPLLDKTIFRYTEDILKDATTNDYSKILAIVLTNPIIEQLYKGSFKVLAIKILNGLNDWDQSFTKVSSKYLGKINDKEKTLYRKLGINKYQAIFFANELKDPNAFKGCYNKSKIIPVVKCIFADAYNENSVISDSLSCEYTDISSIDNATFDRAVKVANKLLDNSYYRLKNYFAIIKKVTDKSNNIQTFECLIECINLGTETKYIDYLNLYKACYNHNPDTVKGLKIYFAGPDAQNQIETAHNMLSELFNTIKYAAEAEKFNEALKKIQKYKFEGDNFIAITPTAPQDLAKEGMTLHHCVKSYIGRVSNGYTNIMFIRKKEDPDTPFYTVEISNNGTIEQIHGFGNCNVETGSDLEKFINEWIKTKKLNSSNFNKIR